MESKSLFLSFQADGIYWQDLVYLPAYPQGFTYEKWPFRYRDKWLDSTVKANLTGWINQGSRLRLDATLVARFKTKNLASILPLRRIEITRAHTEAGMNHFYFKLGSLRDFRETADLKGACYDLLANEWFPNADDNPLIFYSGADVSTAKWCSPADEAISWARLVELIGGGADFPLTAEAKTAVYPRFSIPEYKTKPVSVSQLFNDEARGDIFGAVLEEGSQYSFKVTHKYAQNPVGSTAPKLSYKYEPGNRHLELTAPLAEVIGNYQTTPISIAAVSASTLWEEFVVRASLAPTIVVVGDSKSGAELFALPIPFRIQPNWFYRLKSRWVWRVLLFLALAIQGGVTYFSEFWSKFLEGKASLSDLTHYPFVWLSLILTSALATFAVSGIQDRAKPK